MKIFSFIISVVGISLLYPIKIIIWWIVSLFLMPNIKDKHWKIIKISKISFRAMKIINDFIKYGEKNFFRSYCKHENIFHLYNDNYHYKFSEELVEDEFRKKIKTREPNNNEIKAIQNLIDNGYLSIEHSNEILSVNYDPYRSKEELEKIIRINKFASAIKTDKLDRDFGPK